MPKEKELMGDEALNVAQEIRELNPNWIIVEGGEPLLRDKIWDILEVLRNNRENVWLITNGTLINLDTIRRLRELNIQVMISIDSPHPKVYESIRIGAKFNKVVQNAKELATYGLLHSINFTLNKKNYTSIREMFDLCRSIGSPMINIIGLKPCEKYELQLLSKEEYKATVLSLYKSSKRSGVSFFFDEPFFEPVCEEWNIPSCNSLSSESGILVSEKSGCIMGDYIFIEPNGEIKPCTFVPYTVGNAREGIKKVWNSMQNSDFLAKIRDPKTRIGKCKGCKYISKCRGCRARTYALTKDWFASDPACPL
jgi:radical SAM protein with 4Fe4S-binding SPASM domain